MRVRFGDCLLDSETREISLAGAVVHLQPKAFQFLELLLAERPKAVSKGKIHERLWPGTFVSDGTLTSLLAEVRDAIGDEARHPRFVRTVHRFGYAFSGEARDVPAGATDLTGCRISCWLVRGRKRLPLDPGETLIGRDPGVPITIDDRSVSRRHARIVVADDGATLQDLSSKNGTFLGDARVQGQVPLADGDKIRIGLVPLMFRLVPMAESTESGPRT